MNKAFTKSKILVLTENYFIKPDNAFGVVLVSHYLAKDINGKMEVDNKSIEIEYHYPRVAQALRKYADLELVFDDDIENLIEKTEKVYALIESIDKTFKQF